MGDESKAVGSGSPTALLFLFEAAAGVHPAAASAAVDCRANAKLFYCLGTLTASNLLRLDPLS